MIEIANILRYLVLTHLFIDFQRQKIFFVFTELAWKIISSWKRQKNVCSSKRNERWCHYSNFQEAEWTQKEPIINLVLLFFFHFSFSSNITAISKFTHSVHVQEIKKNQDILKYILHLLPSYNNWKTFYFWPNNIYTISWNEFLHKQ